MSSTVTFEGHTLTIHRREDWQDPALPVHSTNAFEWDTDTAAVHYTAAVDLPDGDPDELVPGKPGWWLVPSYLRRIQRDYQLNRGYAIGYSWPIDYLGGIWEARGWDFECAANVGWNPRTWAILLLVDGNDAPNEWMLRSCRYLHWQAEQNAQRQQFIRPHSQLGWIKSTNTQVLLPWPGNQTACPGVGGRQKMIVPSGLQGGEYNWHYVLPEPPEEIDMSSDYKSLVKVSNDTKRVTALVLAGCDNVQMFGIPDNDISKIAAKAGVSPTPDNITAQLYDDFQMRALRSAGFRPMSETNFTAANGKVWTGLPG